MFSTLLFNPLAGEETVDVSAVEQALARLQEKTSHLEGDGNDNLDFVPWKLEDGRDPDEIIVICLDKSSSMGVAANFPDTKYPGTNQNELTRVLHSDEVTNF